MKESRILDMFLIGLLAISSVSCECDYNQGFYPWGSYCYRFSDHSYSYSTSEWNCVSTYASKVLYVDSKEENRFIANNMQLYGNGPSNEYGGVFTNHELRKDENANWIVGYWSTNDRPIGPAVYSNVTLWNDAQEDDHVVVDYEGRWNLKKNGKWFNYVCKKENQDFRRPVEEEEEGKTGRSCVVKKSGRGKPLEVKHENYFVTDKGLYYCGNGMMVSSKTVRLTASNTRRH